MALIDKSSIVIPKGFYGKANVLQGFNPQTENLVDLDVVRNTTATRVNEAGLIESVAANVPRRDFLNGGCGELLVEPQRTNLLTYSEQFDNEAWSQASLIGVTSNSIAAPDGTLTGDLIIPTTSSTNHFVFQSFNLTSTDCSSIILAKAETYDQIKIHFGAADQVGVIFDLNGIGSIVSAESGTSGEILALADGWYLCKATIIGATANASYTVQYRPALGGVTVFAGDGVGGVYIWGAQVEEGPYPTSYIPTTASAVTRNRDVISATNIGSLLNDAEGGLYLNASSFSTSPIDISLNDGVGLNRVSFRREGVFRLLVEAGGVVQTNITSGTNTPNVDIKTAARYKNNDFVLYESGQLLVSDDSGNTFANGTLNKLQFSTYGSLAFYGRIRELIVFNNAPTDSELQTLTAF